MSKILLVDDDIRILNSFSRHLCKQGHEVEIVENGADALKKLKTMTIDLIISDMRMQPMDGAELMKQIPEKDYGFPGKIIFTAFDDGEAIELAKLSEGGIFRVEKDRWEVDLQPAIARALEFRKLCLEACEKGKKIARQEEYLDKLLFVRTVANTLGHELNNPLQAINLANELLVKQIGQNQNTLIIDENVKNIRDVADKLANLSEVKEVIYHGNCSRIDMKTN
ncbi:MAG: response regulator [Thermodesulfobacteriota bacterium]